MNAIFPTAFWTKSRFVLRITHFITSALLKAFFCHHLFPFLPGICRPGSAVSHFAFLTSLQCFSAFYLFPSMHRIHDSTQDQNCERTPQEPEPCYQQYQDSVHPVVLLSPAPPPVCSDQPRLITFDSCEKRTPQAARWKEQKHRGHTCRWRFAHRANTTACPLPMGLEVI